MPLLPGLSDVIGRSVSHEGILFVPVLGRFRFSPPRYFLKQHADFKFLPDLMEYPNESLWVRARLIKIFGINHPTGHTMKSLLDFQAVAMEWNERMSAPMYMEPFLLSDTWKGIVGDYGPLDAAIAFRRGVNGKIRSRVTDGFCSLLVSRPGDLGIFCDYWSFGCDEELHMISCDGSRIHEEILGNLNHQPLDRDSDRDWLPFELPRKHKLRDRTKR